MTVTASALARNVSGGSCIGVIAIDGPAGAGKSTVARKLSNRLQFRYLDSGAMYRAIALNLHRRGGTATIEADAVAVAESTSIEFGEDGDTVWLDGEDVSLEIRSATIGQLASELSTHSPVRRALVVLQRQIVAKGRVVVEGRDATTVIAPDADLKVYLTASLEERSLRRLKDFQEHGDHAGFEDVRSQIEERDHRDITRLDSPLKVADGAHLIETAGLSVDEVVDKVSQLWSSVASLGGARSMPGTSNR